MKKLFIFLVIFGLCLCSTITLTVGGFLFYCDTQFKPLNKELDFIVFYIPNTDERTLESAKEIARKNINVYKVEYTNSEEAKESYLNYLQTMFPNTARALEESGDFELPPSLEIYLVKNADGAEIDELRNKIFMDSSQVMIIEENQNATNKPKNNPGKWAEFINMVNNSRQ